jgi:hypothetical protein
MSMVGKMITRYYNAAVIVIGMTLVDCYNTVVMLNTKIIIASGNEGNSAKG